MRYSGLYGESEPDWLAGHLSEALEGGHSASSTVPEVRDFLSVTAHKARVIVNAMRRLEGDPSGYRPGSPERIAAIKAWGVDSEPIAPPMAAEAQGETHTIDAPEGDDGTGGNEYSVNELTGEYRFMLVGRPSAIILPASQVSQLVRDYVKDGGNFTQAELARAQGLVRAEVNAILKSLKVWKNSPPFTPEDIANLSEEELTAKWLAAKIHRVEKKAQLAIWREMERDAMRYREIKRTVIDEVAAAVNEHATAAWPVPIDRPNHSTRRRALFIVATDWHVGRAAWSGYGPNGFDIHECERRIDLAVSRTLEELKYPVEKIFLTVGGDLAHTDGMSRTTTRGTPQDMGISSAEMIVRTTRIMFRLIRRLVEVAPVTLCLHAGNHDQAFDIGLFAALEQAFIDHPYVDTAGDPNHPYSPYQRARYGNTLVGLTHGDNKWKAADLAPLMATRWPVEFTETEHHIWLLGHRHSNIVEDTKGVQVWTMPTITGSDEWHEGAWPHHAPLRLGSHLLDYEWGPVGVIYAHVDKGLDQ